MKLICSLNDCGHIFNDTRGLKKHFEKIHGISADFQQYLKPFELDTPKNTINAMENAENIPQSEQKGDMTPNTLPQNEGIASEFKEIFDLISVKKKLAKEKYIESMYRKLTRDLDNDKEPELYEPIDTETIKAELKQELQAQQPSQQAAPANTQNDLMQTFIQLIAPHIPNIIANLTAPAAKGGGIW